MQDYEKLGAFYLGRPYDLSARAPREGLVLYDSRDLVTHAMIIGMTGSGKTGLGIGIIEEAAIDGVPTIAIDPKGDLPNLLLNFPGLSAAEFRPWINEDEAARRGLAPDAFAEQQASAWREGLGAWGQDAARVARLRDAVDMAIYTPGSSAGLGLSILRSFAAPPAEVRGDAELLAERIATSVTGLLTLVGLDADPVRSREHILLATLVGAAWRDGEDLDLGTLIQRIQAPPMSRVGVLDLEAFYPAKERFSLAMQLNGLLAAPGFAAWLEGQSLDIDRMLYTPAGKPRVAVVSIAHLGDAERMFIVSLLLNEVLSWMRKQPGTTSLRALLYMDEVAGYMPPVANPPSKPPLLTLLKQARAFGVGVVLSTQNPGDLDYKGLSNLGTWMIGRLQTERDKSKVLDGLEGALSGAGAFDRAQLDTTLSALGKRVFLLHNVHEDAPEIFETRWTLSYLRGPVTRDQIRQLMSGRPAVAPSPAKEVGGPSAPTQVAAPAPKPAAAAGSRPVLPPDVPQYFVPAATAASPEYDPRLLGAGRVEFSDAKLGLTESRDVVVLAPFGEGAVGVAWDEAEQSDLGLADLQDAPSADASFAPLPAQATRGKNYAQWQKEFARWLGQSQALDLRRDAATALTSTPGESERDFRIRLQLAIRERRDQEKEKLRIKYAPRVAALQERLRRAEQAVAREQEQASQQKLQTAVSIGSAVLGALLGRKVASAASVGRAASAARTAGRIMKEKEDVARAEDTVGTIKQQLAEFDTQLAADLAAIDAGADALTTPLEAVSLKPKRGGVSVQAVALVWVPR